MTEGRIFKKVSCVLLNVGFGDSDSDSVNDGDNGGGRDNGNRLLTDSRLHNCGGDRIKIGIEQQRNRRDRITETTEQFTV